MRPSLALRPLLIALAFSACASTDDESSDSDASVSNGGSPSPGGTPSPGGSPVAFDAGAEDVLVAPEADAAIMTDGPAGSGACTNADDQAVLQGRAAEATMIVTSCALGCLNQAETCSTECIQRDLGLTGDCATCFGALVTCTFANCLAVCISPDSADCVACRAANCDDGFETCAGFPPR